METEFDVLIVGAGTAGTYLAWLLAKQGVCVAVLEREAREHVGSRLEVFHVDSIAFDKFGIPPPLAGTPELIEVWDEGTTYSADGTIAITVRYGFHVMRLSPFLQRMFAFAVADGATLIFSCRVATILYENQKIVGVIAEKDGESTEFRTRLVVDASGTAAVLRITLPPEYGVETFQLAPEDVMYTILRYIQWSQPDEPHFTGTNGWPFHKAFCNPCGLPDGAILGIGQPGSYDRAEAVLVDFLNTIRFPPFEIVKIERGITPFRRPPFSFVGDAFLCVGDSACITKPFSGEGVTATWTLCQIAARVIGEALAKGGQLTREQLWPINVAYFHDQGAKFAALLAQIPGAANNSAKEMNYLFRKGIIFNDGDMTAMNRDFELRLNLGKIMHIVGSIIWGLLTRRFSLRSVKSLMRSLGVAGKIKKHYEAFPTDTASFPNWVHTATNLWKNASLLEETKTPKKP